MTESQRRGLRALMLGSALVGAVGGGCVSLLDLEDYRDAIGKLCVCDEQLPFLAECQQTLSDRLAAASPEERGEWLSFFDENCADSCQEAYLCYSRAGTCSSASCTQDEECCGYLERGAGVCSSAGVCEP